MAGKRPAPVGTQVAVAGAGGGAPARPCEGALRGTGRPRDRGGSTLWSAVVGFFRADVAAVQTVDRAGRAQRRFKGLVG